jgi:hypothetical protein
LQLNVELFQSYIFLSFSLLSFKVSAISTNRNFSSSNYWCLEKNYLNEPLKSSTNSNLSFPESTDFLRNNYKYVDSNNSTTSKIKNADILKAKYGLNREKWGFLARFHLRIKFFYRRLIIRVKKGIRMPILPPKLFNLLGHFLNRLFIFLGSFCMKM